MCLCLSSEFCIQIITQGNLGRIANRALVMILLVIGVRETVTFPIEPGFFWEHELHLLRKSYCDLIEYNYMCFVLTPYHALTIGYDYLTLRETLLSNRYSLCIYIIQSTHLYTIYYGIYIRVFDKHLAYIYNITILSLRTNLFNFKHIIILIYCFNLDYF